MNWSYISPEISTGICGFVTQTHKIEDHGADEYSLKRNQTSILNRSR